MSTREYDHPDYQHSYINNPDNYVPPIKSRRRHSGPGHLHTESLSAIATSEPTEEQNRKAAKFLASKADGDAEALEETLRMIGLL